VINISSEKVLDQVQRDIRQSLNPKKYEVLRWEDMLVELVQQIKSDNVSGQIMIGILYMIVTFGMFGTLIMMTTERTREFGVMVAVGLRKSKLICIVFLETLYMTILSIIIGILASLPIIYHYYIHPVRFSAETAKSIENFGIEPVLPFAWDAGIFVNQAIIVFILTIIALTYPLLRLGWLKVTNALQAR
jgi:ABC-type lipoprotein release transport system permease subunit